ncbi:MAG: hypothetical protein Q8R24_04870, partial [Legionellaceae bacterium]|nr:hypothetical protein [Legionellaceae bacterium]
GKTRASEAPQGLDHDYAADATLVPLGILNLKSDCKEFRLPRKKWRNINLKLSALQIYQNGTLEFSLPIRLPLCEVGGQSGSVPTMPAPNWWARYRFAHPTFYHYGYVIKFEIPNTSPEDHLFRIVPLLLAYS